MSNNFFPLSAEELIKRINKIPKVKLAMLPTALEYLPNISNELEINLNPKITQYNLKKKVYPKGRSTMGMAGTKARKNIKKWKPKK